MARQAEAEWKGDLKGGSGRVKTRQRRVTKATTRSRPALKTAPAPTRRNCSARRTPDASRWPWPTRSHQAGFTPTSVHTKADVHLNKDDKGFLINLIELTVDAVVPKVDNATFQQHVEKTKTGCIISRALGAIPTMNVKATLKN